MKLTDVDHQAVVAAIDSVSSPFRTREVSGQPAMLTAHPESADYSYHPTIGKYLRREEHALGVRFLRTGSAPKGAHWAKTGEGRSPAGRGRPAPASSPPAAADALGPQYHGDPAFTARMRLHQSHYRATVLGLPCGTGPTASDNRSLGNMLTREDGAAGRNFLTPEIYEIVRRRLAESSDRVEPFRLLHNMLSSQPMCFNLFGPLVDDSERARRLIGALLPGEVARVRRVVIEHAPVPASEYLADRTSFDAFVEYERPDGARAMLGIETKLTDSFSPKRYDQPEYRRWMTGPLSPWRPEAREAVASERHNQIWRDHLLAISMRDRAGSAYQTARLLIVHDALDQEALSAVASYRSLLQEDDDTFRSLTIAEVVMRFEAAAETDDERARLAAFRARYLALERSEGAWQARSSRKAEG